MNPSAGFTDWHGGHAGVLFADVVELLTPRTVAERDLGLRDLDVLRRAVARGALVVAYHPLVTPLALWPATAFARVDISWRPLSGSALPRALHCPFAELPTSQAANP